MKGGDCLKDAVRYLSLRSRTEAEISEYLGRKGHSAASIEEAVGVLKAEKLLDDCTLAARWAEQLAEKRSIGSFMAVIKLVQRGISRGTAEAVVSKAWEGIDETELAFEIASGFPIDRLDREQNEKDRARIARHLKAKGFDQGAIAGALRRFPDAGHNQS